MLNGARIKGTLSDDEREEEALSSSGYSITTAVFDQAM